MRKLWVFYQQYYQILDLDDYSYDTISLGSDINYTITIQQFPLQKGPYLIKLEEENLPVVMEERSGKVLGELYPEKGLDITEKHGTIKLYLTLKKFNTQLYYIGNRQEITVSADEKEADIHLQRPDGESSSAFTLYKNGDGWFVEDALPALYKNGQKLIGNNDVDLGDILFTPFATFRLLEKDVLEISSMTSYECELPLVSLPDSEMKRKYPSYRRTPRMLYELPTEKVRLTFPSQQPDDSHRGLWLIILPPLVMLIVMGVVALIQPRGIFIIITMVMFVTTLITSSVQYFKDRSNFKRREKNRKKIYSAYLNSKREELNELSEQQRHFLQFHFPSFERMKYLTNEVSERIWERSLVSEDFLQFRLGIGTVESSYDVDLNTGDMASRELDELVEESQLIEKVYSQVENVPVIAELHAGPIGLVGKKTAIKKELHKIVGQLAFFHSYHDIRFVFIFDEDEYEEWEWMKWLPHFRMPHMAAAGFIYNDLTRDQLLSSLYEILRERDLEEEKEKLLFSPHIVFINFNQQLIGEHVILEYLEGDHRNLGISVITATESKGNLADNIHTLVRYVNDQEGEIIIQKKKAVSIAFRHDDDDHGSNEAFARRLRNLDHQTGVHNSIPQSVTFLEMMNASDVNQLPIQNNWLSNESAKSLAVPIGLKGKEDQVFLNLHEKAHGPHGLLAGTTGSGKSEFLQSYILSLAVHFHPHEVAFLLIDYKGGGMAQPFKNMPHLLGTITNIEGSKNFSARALASIRSELKRRQRLFDQYNVNHINDYTSLYKMAVTDEPLPHLFLISDEFAELKNEEPEFIRELVSAARIGRSLGVHLILATQKPGGVIDDQIWSNARFRVALKVQDATDSKEILKNSDAASITVTGRGYLQVGNNEVYELFQSAWSGAPYLEEKSEAEDEIALVTDLGLVPLSQVGATTHRTKAGISEIEAVVSRIEDVKRELSIDQLRSPWLPPLEARVVRDRFRKEEPGVISVALADEPEKQSQYPLLYQAMDDGNIGVFGSSGYGKSYTIMTILLGLAEKYTPEELHYYIMDFGNGTLFPLRQLPHTADFFSIDDEKKIEKFIRKLKGEITRRKQLFQRYEVSSIKIYNRVSEQKLPLIFITVENYDFIKEEMQDMDPYINQFVRDGQSLGIYMMLSATKVMSVRQAVMNNLKTKIVHYLFDQSEAYAIIGRTEFSPEPVPGRAIIKRNEAYFSQVFLPAEGADDLEVLDAVRSLIQSLKKRYEDAQKPLPIPMLPDDLDVSYFNRLNERNKDWLIPIGLDEEFVQPVFIDLETMKHCLVAGQAQKGKTNVLKVIINTLLGRQGAMMAIFDSIDRGLADYMEEQNITYMETKEQIENWAALTEEMLTMRESAYLAASQAEKKSLRFEPITLIVDGYARFSQICGSVLQEKMAGLMRNYSHLGFHIIVTGNSNELAKGYDPLTTEVKQIRQAILLVKKSEQTLYTLPYDRKEAELQTGFGYYVVNGKEVKMKIPLCAEERKVLS